MVVRGKEGGRMGEEKRKDGGRGCEYLEGWREDGRGWKREDGRGWKREDGRGEEEKEEDGRKVGKYGKRLLFGGRGSLSCVCVCLYVCEREYSK